MRLIPHSTTFPLSAPDGTAAAPAYAFASEMTLGWYRAASGFMALADGTQGSVVFVKSTPQLILGSGGIISWVSTADAVNGTVDVKLSRVSAGVLGPNADIGVALGSSAKRFTSLSLSAVGLFIYTSASDANAALLLTNGVINWGAGGAAGTDLALTRLSTNAGPYLQLQPQATLTGSPADLQALELAPILAGAFTVTRYSYVRCLQITGAATITDAAAFGFNAAIGTHKALAANAAVATVMSGVGPTGASTAIQGWIKMNINGTLRYVPFW